MPVEFAEVEELLEETEWLTLKGHHFCVRPKKDDFYHVREILVRKKYSGMGIKFTPHQKWLDAGAGVGGFAMQASECWSKVFCFEPNPTLFQLLRLNVEHAALKPEPVLFQTCISGRLEPRQILCRRTGWATGLGSLFNHTGPSDKLSVTNIYVPVAIDQLKIDNIKLDVEGCEYEIINKIQGRQWERIQQFICEWHYHQLEDVYFRRAIEILKKYFDEVNVKKRSKLGNLKFESAVICARKTGVAD